MSNFYKIYFEWLGQIIDIHDLSRHQEYLIIHYRDFRNSKIKNSIKFHYPNLKVTTDVDSCSSIYFLAMLSDNINAVIIKGNKILIQNKDEEAWFEIIKIEVCAGIQIANRIRPPKRLKDT